MKGFRTKSMLRKSLGVAIVYGLVAISGGSSRVFAAPLDIMIEPGIPNPLGIQIDPLGPPTAGINMNNHDIYNVKDITSVLVIGTTVSTGVGGANMTGNTVSTGVGGASMSGSTVSTGSGVTLITLDGLTGEVSTNTLETSGVATLDAAQVTNTLNVDGATTTHGLTNTGDVQTGTLHTTGLATLNSAQVTTTLGVTGNLTLGGDILDSNSGNGILTLSANDAQLTNSAGHGLTVVGSTTTLSGGTNTSTWTLTDGSAILDVAGTSGTAKELINASTSATSTNPQVTVGAATSGNVTVNDDGVTLRNNGSPARLRGVEDGVDYYDGVNMHQLNRLARNAYSGIAQIAAMTAIPSPPAGHRYAFGVGVGTYGGEQAIAIGAKAAVSDNLMFAGSVGAGLGSKHIPMAGAAGASLSW
jgi:trimeric autotransporter adhesin